MIIPTIDWRTKNLTESDFISHELHPTWMEQFMKCPYQYHVAEHPELFPNVNFWTSETARDAFYEWDITEQLMTAYQYGEKLGDEVLRNFGNSTEFAQFSRLKKHAENWKQYLTSSEKAISDRFPLFTQKRMSLRILMDWDRKPHEFYLTGTADSGKALLGWASSLELDDGCEK